MKGLVAIRDPRSLLTAVALRITVNSVLVAAAFVWLTALPVAAQSNPPATAQPGAPPRVLVAIYLGSRDFQMVSSGMFRGKKDVIPLVDYDFGAALVDEVVAQLSTDKRATFRAATPDETRLLTPQLASKEPNGWPDSVAAERIMVIKVLDFGGFYRPGLPRKFNVTAGVVLYDRPSGRKLWDKGYYEQIGMPSSIEAAQRDSQAGLKEGLNKLIEKLAEKIKKRVAESTL